jgi:hypothetical protein
MHKITNVEVLDQYRLAVAFEDGVHGTVDLHSLVGSGVFAIWTDYDAFRRVRIGDSGELIWSEDVDLCPDSLYLQATGKDPAEVFPGLKRELANA